MKKANYSRTLYVIIPDRSVVSTETHSLLEQLPMNAPLCEPTEIFNHVTRDKHKIVLFDYQQRQGITPYLSTTAHSNHNVETVVFNVPYRISTEKLLELGNLKGLFYSSDGMEKLNTGLNSILTGQNWLPRHVASQLIHYYRHIFRNQTLKATVDLTAREIQILRSLQTGASNLQMAEHLFISEFTVKSHLYQIFKKISVKNRSQAISWANQNLVS
jgi:LuxR family transcriptional regulator, csgAB operon transcriptional regulatory protein